MPVIGRNHVEHNQIGLIQIALADGPEGTGVSLNAILATPVLDYTAVGPRSNAELSVEVTASSPELRSGVPIVITTTVDHWPGSASDAIGVNLTNLVPLNLLLQSGAGALVPTASYGVLTVVVDPVTGNVTITWWAVFMPATTEGGTP